MTQEATATTERDYDAKLIEQALVLLERKRNKFLDRQAPAPDSGRHG